jgi:hypothetical protein
MTITDDLIFTTENRVTRLATVELYRDIHKGIRAELFDVTEQAGSIDPGDRAARVSLAERVRDVVDTLEAHAHHEDGYVEPVLQEHLPDLAEKIGADHASFARRTDDLVTMAFEAVEAPAQRQYVAVHGLYLDLASFTSVYLAHQDLEERVVAPALEDAIGVEGCVAINRAIVASIPPDQMAASLAFMLPAMNVDDRTALLGGVQAGAPPEVFQGVFKLAGSVLSPVEHAALATRLGVA